MQRRLPLVALGVFATVGSVAFVVRAHKPRRDTSGRPTATSSSLHAGANAEPELDDGTDLGW